MTNFFEKLPSIQRFKLNELKTKNKSPGKSLKGSDSAEAGHINRVCEQRHNCYHQKIAFMTLTLWVHSVSSADNLCKQLRPRSGPTILSGLIGIQTV